ncbi:MAG: patatin-like phospholipase family protein [Burkholderiaceae bacterium]
MASRAGRDSPAINLALQGGGSHGAYTWGVLDRLLEDGRLGFEALSGASAGAMNAVALAHGWAQGGRDGARESLADFWRRVGDAGAVFGPGMVGGGSSLAGLPNVPDWWIAQSSAMAASWYEMLSRSFSPYQLNPANLNPLRGLLESSIDFERLRAGSPIQVFVSASNVRTGHVRVFDSSELSVDVLLASACLPTVFQAVEIDGEAYWDGGYLADPPLFPFFYACRSRDVLLVMVNPLAHPEVPRSATEILDRLNELSFNASLIAEMRAIAFAQKLVREDWLVPERRDAVKDMLIHAVLADGVLSDLGAATKFLTAPTFLKDLRERGRQAADRWLESAFAQLGKRSSIDIRRLFLAQ